MLRLSTCRFSEAAEWGWRRGLFAFWRLPACQAVDERAKNEGAVGAAKKVFAGTFWMRHHAQYIAACIYDSGNVAYGAVWVRSAGYLSIRSAIPEDNTVVIFQFLYGGWVRIVAAVIVRDGNAEHLTLGGA